jgi:hypothetical protein
VSDAGRYSEVGAGVLARGSAWVYWWVVLELLVVATSLPGLVPLLLLDHSPGNVPLLALCLLPVGPSLSAAVFAWNKLVTTPPADRDLRPAAAYLRGYRLNWRDVLVWWLPLLVVLAFLGFNMANAGLVFGDADPGSVSASTLAYLAIAVAVLVWGGNALVLTSLFSFRTRDVARLASYYLGRRPMASLGVLSLMVVAAAAALFVGDLLVVALASGLALLLVLTTRAMIEDVAERFVAPAGARGEEPGDDASE